MKTLELGDRERAGLYALGGTLSLFLLPLLILIQFFSSDTEAGVLSLALVLILCAALMATGIWCFWKSVKFLLAHSQREAQKRR
jgi:lipopolysaccharide export LptBFGC system permease protein LptF